MTSEIKTGYELGVDFYYRKIEGLTAKLPTAQGMPERLEIIDGLELFQLKLRQLNRKKAAGILK